MQTDEIKNINFLGQKRSINSQMPINLTEEEKTKEYFLKQLTPKKPDIFITFKEAKKRIILEEQNDTKIDNNINKDIKNVNIIHNIICQKCNSKDNILSFNNVKSIVDFFSKKNISLFNNLNLDEYLNYDTPKTICIKCLLVISKNKTEFAKFFGVNNNKINDENDNVFDDLFENPNLKNFNNIETKKCINITNKNKNKNNSLEELSNKIKDILDNFNSKNAKIPTLLNNIPSKNNNIFNNQNINFDLLNISNYLPLINFNIPFNKNFSNLSIPNINKNDLNTCLNDFKTKNNNINQTNLLQHQILNNKDILQNSLFNKPPGLFTPNNTDLLNLFKSPLLNKNSSTEKNNKKENGQSIITNNNETKNNKEKNDKDVKENLDKNNDSNGFTKIKNKDFDEIFEMANHLYNKLLDIKVSRDLNLVSKNIFDKGNQMLPSNNLKIINNKLEENSNINLILNQNSNEKNLGEKKFNCSNNKSNNDLFCNQNVVINKKLNDKV